jgi:hypothetical protein
MKSIYLPCGRFGLISSYEPGTRDKYSCCDTFWLLLCDCDIERNDGRRAVYALEERSLNLRTKSEPTNAKTKRPTMIIRDDHRGPSGGR